MEYGLRERPHLCMTIAPTVLILVLMEYGLRELDLTIPTTSCAAGS